MIKAIVSLQLIFTIFVTFGQEHGGLLKQETLIQNRVHTIFQYSVTDSVQFMKDYPNGYYSIFNEDGRMIEAIERWYEVSNSVELMNYNYTFRE